MNSIIMYTSSTWPHCVTAKDFLSKKGYPYQEKNVSEDPVARTEMRKLKMMGVPAFVIGEETIVGFNPEAIENAIDFKMTRCPKCDTPAKLPKEVGHVKVTCKSCDHTYDVNE